VKRQVSDRELVAIRIGVGVTVTLLTYMVAVAWTCGTALILTNIISQFKRNPYYYGFIYIVISWLNIGAFYNMVEFVLWKLGMRLDFVPRIPPSELNDEWIILSKEQWIAAIKGRIFLWLPLWFLFVSWIFSHHAERFCSKP
jgi:hypothetical protein